MPSTPTARLRLERQQLGEGLNVWGDTKLNEALERIDEAIAGIAPITISGASTVLTSTNYATDQSRRAVLLFTGTLTANSSVTVPNVEKTFLCVNNTTGNYSLTLKTAAGSGYVLRSGPQIVYCNGTDVFRASPRLDQVPAPAAAVDLAGQKLTTVGAPTLGGDAATKTYVDAQDATLLAGATAQAQNAAGHASAASASASAAAGSASSAASSASSAASSASAADASADAAALSESAAAASAASIAAGPVASVNGQSGVVTITAAGLGAVTSVNGKSGPAAVITASDIGGLDAAMGTAIKAGNTGFTVTSINPVGLLDNGRTFQNSDTTTGFRGGRGGIARSSGKYYFEIKVNNGTSLSSWGIISTATTAPLALGDFIGQRTGTWGLCNTTSDGFYAQSTSVSYLAAIAPAAGSIIGIAVDFDNGRLWASHNGTWVGSGNPQAGTNPGLDGQSFGSAYPASSAFISNGQAVGTVSHTLRTAMGEFSYSPPNNFLPWAEEPATTAVAGSPVLTGTTAVKGRAVSTATGMMAGDIDISTAQFFAKIISAHTTITISNPPPMTTAQGFVLRLVNAGAWAITWPSTVKWPGGTAPTFTASGTDIVACFTDDGGANYRCVLAQKDSK